MTTPSALQTDLTIFIADIAYLDEGELQPDTALFSTGIIDSVSLLELVCFVEAQAGIKVRPDELTLTHWDSLVRILAFIAAKRG